MALTEVAALALLGCALWMWAATTAVVVDVLRGARTPAPAGLHAASQRAYAGWCWPPAASPSPAVSPSRRTPRARTSTGPRPSPVSRSPTAPWRVSAHVRRTVRVRPGDTLWSLAARDLPVDSPDASIAARWHAIYAANRSLIGPDPDVIEPGLRLRLPGKDPS